MEIVRDSVFDPGSGTYIDNFSNTPRQVDVIPTIFEFLCIPVESSWGLEGTSLISACPPIASQDEFARDADQALLAFPNPSTGTFNINTSVSSNLNLTVTDALGRNVAFDYSKENSGFIINFLNPRPGLYRLTIIDNQMVQHANLMILD